LFWFPDEFRKGEKKGELKGSFGFRSRIRVERPIDIAVWGIVSTRVLHESAQNFAAIQRKLSCQTFGGCHKLFRRQDLPNATTCGRLGTAQIALSADEQLLNV